MTNQKHERITRNVAVFMPMLLKKFIKKTISEHSNFASLYLSICMKHSPESTMTFLSEKMSVPKSNLTKTVDKLVKEQLVVRESDENDRRVILIRITPKGEEYFEEKMRQVDRLFKHELERFSDEDISDLDTHLEGVIKIMSKYI